MSINDIQQYLNISVDKYQKLIDIYQSQEIPKYQSQVIVCMKNGQMKNAELLINNALMLENHVSGLVLTINYIKLLKEKLSLFINDTMIPSDLLVLTSGTFYCLSFYENEELKYTLSIFQSKFRNFSYSDIQQGCSVDSRLISCFSIQKCEDNVIVDAIVSLAKQNSISLPSSYGLISTTNLAMPNSSIQTSMPSDISSYSSNTSMNYSPYQNSSSTYMTTSQQTSSNYSMPTNNTSMMGNTVSNTNTQSTSFYYPFPGQDLPKGIKAPQSVINHYKSISASASYCPLISPPPFPMSLDSMDKDLQSLNQTNSMQAIPTVMSKNTTSYNSTASMNTMNNTMNNNMNNTMNNNMNTMNSTLNKTKLTTSIPNPSQGNVPLSQCMPKKSDGNHSSVPNMINTNLLINTNILPSNKSVMKTKASSQLGSHDLGLPKPSTMGNSKMNFSAMGNMSINSSMNTIAPPLPLYPANSMNAPINNVNASMNTNRMNKTNYDIQNNTNSSTYSNSVNYRNVVNYNNVNMNNSGITNTYNANNTMRNNTLGNNQMMNTYSNPNYNIQQNYDQSFPPLPNMSESISMNPQTQNTSISNTSNSSSYQQIESRKHPIAPISLSESINCLPSDLDFLSDHFVKMNINNEKDPPKDNSTNTNNNRTK